MTDTTINNNKESTKAISLRLPENLYKKIETLSEEQIRSVNSQIEWMLREYIRQNGK